MINHFVGVGRLTAEADFRYTANGTACVKFSLCINKSIKKGDNWEEKPHFFNCVVWGKYAEAMKKHMNKGRRVGIEGELSHNPWTDNQGVKHNDVSIVVNNITLLDAPRSGDNHNQGKEPAAGRGNPGAGSPGGEESYNDEVPF
jgi:single-strand DNA-binding protein